MRGAHGQVIPVKRLDDRVGQYPFALVCVRVLMGEIAKDIPTSARFRPSVDFFFINDFIFSQQLEPPPEYTSVSSPSRNP